jgi:hypothetical protein
MLKFFNISLLLRRFMRSNLQNKQFSQAGTDLRNGHRLIFYRIPAIKTNRPATKQTTAKLNLMSLTNFMEIYIDGWARLQPWHFGPWLLGIVLVLFCICCRYGELVSF